MADSVLARVCSSTVRVAFLIFYLRIFKPIRHVRYMVWIGVGVVVTFCIAFVIIDIVACAPWPSEHGDWSAPSLIDRCERIAVDLITAASYMSVITDLYILIIPMHQLPSLNLSKRRKIGVGMLFLTGLL